jgi:hypothetical protein
MKFLLALALLAASPAFAKGSSHPKSGSEGGSVMDAVVVPRALIWENSRLWQTTEGTILVCPHEFRVAGIRQWEDNECYNDKIKGDGKQSRWMPLQDYKVPGMVLKSYEYRFLGSGGTKTLITYYGPPAPPAAPVVAGRMYDADLDAVLLALSKAKITVQTNGVVVNAPKVIVQRVKK